MSVLTQESAQKLFAYCPLSGRLVWRPANRRMAGRLAGSITKGSVRVNCEGKTYGAHRIIWLLAYGTWPTLSIDHINGNPADNRLSNLREATHSENVWNSRRRSSNSSGYKGVSFDKSSGKWQARIMRNYFRVHIGLFDSPQLAYEAYCAAANAMHGEFARVA